MKYETQNFISPNFDSKKLDSPSYEDLVDVFEDRIKNWVLKPAEHLLKIPHCQIASVNILMAYFEGIEIYFSGEDSSNKSFDFFAKGFSKVFPIHHKDKKAIEKVHRAIYKQIRCGFAHDGMFRNRVMFSDIPSEPIIFTFPKKNGNLDFTQIESIVVNPSVFFESIKNHFEDYLKILRAKANITIKQNFEKIVKLSWGLNDDDRVIGMTEEEFYNT